MKLALHGYGKMGRTIERVAREAGHDVVCILDVDRDDPLAGAEVLIDFSHASALDHALGIACENGLDLVIGTTGWNDRMHDVRTRVEAAAQSAGLRIEVNTLVLRNNVADLDAIAALIRPLDIIRWNVHFLVPVGASRELGMITAGEVERVFETLEEIRARERFALRIVEAPHYRRFRVQRILQSLLASDGAEWSDFAGYVGEGDGAQEVLESALDGARSFVYVSHAGEVRPSELAPHAAGNLRYRDLGMIYRGSDLFVALRNPDNLHGKCRHCEFRILCGGSRARAYAMTGDLFGSDPLCAYEPEAQNRIPLVARTKETDT